MHVLRRIDPTLDELRAALDGLFRQALAALAGAPEGVPPRWHELEERAGDAEGVLSRTYQLDHRRLDYLAAWWTDPVGRKQWFLQVAPELGHQPPGDAIAHLSWGPARTNEDHPLSHIAPPLSFLWKWDGEYLVPFVACRCGFAGPPASLNWMGDRCGPCFDREQENLPPLGLEPWRRDLGKPDHFAVAPDGRLVTLRFDNQQGATRTPVVVRVWAPPYIGKPLWRREWSDSVDWAVACSKTKLALQAGRRITVVNLDDGRTCDSVAVPEANGPAVLAFAGLEGDRLLSLYGDRLRAWSLDEEGRISRSMYDIATSKGGAFLAMSPLGQRVLLPSLATRETATGEVIERLAFEGRTINSAVFVSDGAIIAEGKIGDFAVPPPGVLALARWPHDPAPAGVGMWEWLMGQSLRKPAQIERESDLPEGGLAVSADGGIVAAFGDDGMVGRLLLIDPLTLRTSADFNVKAGLVEAAFSPDGQLLVLTGAGLAVYPWRELVRSASSTAS